MIKWKTVFYVCSLLVFIEMVQIVNDQSVGLFDVGSLLLHLFSLISIYGYTFSKAIGTLWLAKRVWFLNVFTWVLSAVFLLSLSMLADPVEDQTMILILLFFAFSAVCLVPMYRYAYKSENLWAKNA